MVAALSKSAQAHKDSDEALREELENDRRDLADLWNKALLDYRGSVGTDLQAEYGNVKEIADFASKELDKFQKFRHSKNKVDKLRSFLRDNLECIKRGTQQLATAATLAFPPAAAIGAALTCLITACHGVSRDFDLVVDCFEDMNSFLGRVIIIEKRVPNSKPYHNRLMDVFTAFLSMCGIAKKCIEFGRFKRWASRLKGEDSDLTEARQNMDKALDSLQRATHLAILGKTESLQEMNEELLKNQDHHTKMLEAQRKKAGSLHDRSS
ncbi:Goodbye domain-containing protein [Fusarium sp. LHS14.1]|nr:Goodbye domain-containing protein [Fusarium sp. LHS14.1]